MDIGQLQLLEKLVQLYSWSPVCCDGVRNLALQFPSDFNKKLEQVEYWLSKSEPDKPNPDAKQALDETCNKIYEIALYLDPVRSLMCSKPLFSETASNQIGAYASFADIVPHQDPAIMLYSRDALFCKVLDFILKQISQTAEDIFREGLSTLISIYLIYPDTLKQLYSLAENYNWLELTQEIQTVVETSGADSVLKSLPASAKVIIQQIESQRDKKQDTVSIESTTNESNPQSDNDTAPNSIFLQSPIYDLLFGSSGITVIQREEVLLFKQVEEANTMLKDFLLLDKWKDYSLRQKSNEVAKHIIEKKYIPEDSYRQALGDIAIRIEAAQHYVELRRYAKFNALNYTWPELASELIGNQSRFSAFESRMLDTDTLQDEAKGQGELVKLLQRYKDNDQLLRFLRLRPYFSGLNLHKAKEMLNLSASLPKVETSAVQLEKIAQESSEMQPGTEGPLFNVVDNQIDLYKNIHIDIALDESSDATPDEINYLVELSHSDADERVRSRITVSRQSIHSLREDINNLYRYASPTQSRSPEEAQNASRLPASSSSQRAKLLSNMIKELGARLYSMFFDPNISTYLNKFLSRSSKTRFVLQIKDPILWILPWESLYVPELRLAIALVSKYSIVRFLPGAGITPQPWGAKLRILTIYSNPVDLPAIMLEEEEKTLVEVLSKSQFVEIRQIQHVTLEKFLHEMRVFQPNVIHFGGHGNFNGTTGEGSLYFEQSDGRGMLVHASQFSDWIVGTSVSLVLLNACDTGTSDINDAVTSLAGSLVASGVPMAIATTRAIFDVQSIIFVREFYRALVDGYTVEASISEARKRVNGEEWDWSVFALFANTLGLERYKLITEKK
jgi:hypothetical protein